MSSEKSLSTDTRFPTLETTHLQAFRGLIDVLPIKFRSGIFPGSSTRFATAPPVASCARSLSSEKSPSLDTLVQFESDLNSNFCKLIEIFLNSFSLPELHQEVNRSSKWELSGQKAAEGTSEEAPLINICTSTCLVQIKKFRVTFCLVLLVDWLLDWEKHLQRNPNQSSVSLSPVLSDC